MEAMSKNIRNFGELLSKYGYSMPKTEDEVLAFENKYKSTYESPISWDSIDTILEGRSNKVLDGVIKEFNPSVEYLSLAAREGKGLSEEIKKKMNEDRDNARKQ